LSDSAETAHAQDDGALMRLLDSALRQAQKLVDMRIERLREQHPDADDAVLLKKLERTFVSSATSSGAAVGAAATVPGVGTAASVAAAAGDASFFLTAAAAHMLSVARLRGLNLETFEHQKALVMMVLLGGSSSSLVAKVAERTGLHWGTKAANAVPLSAIKSANKILGPYFVTRFGAQRGILVLGRAAPMGFGAAIGGGGNYLLAKSITKATVTTIDASLAEGRVEQQR
jgi:hypothetical protein